MERHKRSQPGRIAVPLPLHASPGDARLVEFNRLTRSGWYLCETIPSGFDEKSITAILEFKEPPKILVVAS